MVHEISGNCLAVKFSKNKFSLVIREVSLVVIVFGKVRVTSRITSTLGPYATE